MSKTTKLPVKKQETTIVKAIHKVKHYIRSYADRTHPECYEDYEVPTRTARPKLIEAVNAEAYQFYDIMTLTYATKLEIDDVVSDPRNFSPIVFVVEEDDDDE